MALAWPLVAGLLVAPLLGGRLSALGDLRIRVLPLFYVGLALQLAAFPFKMFPWRTPDRVGIVLWLVSYGFFVLACLFNARIPGVPLVAVGMLSNLVAICSNGGHMPALPSALRGAGMHFTQSNNSVRMPSPHLAMLVDRWAVPSWVPWGNVFSVGDIFIAFGGFVFALGAMKALPWLRSREAASDAAPVEVPEPVFEAYVPGPAPRTEPRPRKSATATDVLITIGVIALAFGAAKALPKLRRAAALPS